MNIGDMPFGKGRPTSNSFVHVVLMIAAFVAFVMYPGPVLTVGASVALFFIVRSIARDLRKEWFPKNPGWVVIGKDGTKRLDETDEGRLFNIVGLKNKCPDCGGIGFFDGPSGGMSTNIICMNAACRSKFNITHFSGTAGTCDRIGRDPLSALDSFPPESFGKNLTAEQLAAAKAKIIADETAVRPLTEGMAVKGGLNEYPSQITERPAAPGAVKPKECGTCHAPLDAAGMCPNN